MPETGRARAILPQEWRVLAHFAVVGFLVMLKPSEAYLNLFITHDKGFSNAEIDHDVYPIWPYAYCGFALALVFAAEAAGLVAVVLFHALSFLATRLLLLFGQSLFAMQMTQVAYGAATAGQLFYSAFVFQCVRERTFPLATATVETALLLGEAIAALSGGILESLNVSLRFLNWISLVTVSAGCVGAALLPLSVREARAAIAKAASAVEASCPASSPHRAPDADKAPHQPKACTTAAHGTLERTITFINLAVRDRGIRRLLFYFAAQLALVNTVENYEQTLWQELQPTARAAHNGYASASATVLAAGVAVGALAAFRREQYSFVQSFRFLTALSVVQAAFLVLPLHVRHVEAAYASYCASRALYSFAYTIIATQLSVAATRLRNRSHGFQGLFLFESLFGAGAFVGLAGMAALAAVLSSSRFNVTDQFYIMAGLYACFAVLFTAADLISPINMQVATADEEERQSHTEPLLSFRERSSSDSE